MIPYEISYAYPTSTSRGRIHSRAMTPATPQTGERQMRETRDHRLILATGAAAEITVGKCTIYVEPAVGTYQCTIFRGGEHIRTIYGTEFAVSVEAGIDAAFEAELGARE